MQIKYVILNVLLSYCSKSFSKDCGSLAGLHALFLAKEVQSITLLADIGTSKVRHTAVSEASAVRFAAG